MGLSKLPRREFLQRAATGAVALGSEPIWSRAGLRQRTPAAGSHAGNWVGIPTREHFGDTEERLEIPPSWDLKLFHMAGRDAPELTSGHIRERVEKPVGTKRLADIARGKRTAVITFDDLTRPTPVYEIIPHVIAELKLGGIRDEGILFLASYGSHRPMVQDEAACKLGARCVDQYPWINHNVFENVAEVGRTTRGNLIKINRHFVQADVRVTISGVKSHVTAGYGGGAKAVLPGVAWIESIHFFHTAIAGLPGHENPTVGLCKIFHNDVRLDMVEAARMAKVDFSVQVVYNGYRKVIGVHAGDIVDAHHSACREANRLHRTEETRNADVVVVNAYPQNLQANTHLGWARTGLRDGGTAVLIAQHPRGLQSWHFLDERWEYDPRSYFESAHPSRWVPKQAGQLIVYSSYLQARDRQPFPANTIYTRTWADTVAAINKVHRDSARVALYPYAGMQHRPADLDG